MKFVSIFLYCISSCILTLAQSTKKAPSKPIDNSLAASAERGKSVYAKECMSCHQADGGGVPRLNPPLAESTDVVGDKSKIIKIVLNGMDDRLPIDGEYYSNTMATHAHLTNQEIADVLTYIRNNFGNKASQVLPIEVNALRQIKKTTNKK